jgi:hypothetical protein
VSLISAKGGCSPWRERQSLPSGDLRKILIERTSQRCEQVETARDSSGKKP